MQKEQGSNPQGEQQQDADAPERPVPDASGDRPGTGERPSQRDDEGRIHETDEVIEDDDEDGVEVTRNRPKR